MTDTLREAALLPCPFCGHTPRPDNYIDSIHPLDREQTLWTAGCLVSEGGCDASVLAGTGKEAISKWNTRAALAQPKAQPEQKCSGTYGCTCPLHFSQPKAQEPVGWKLVPIEPTPEMLSVVGMMANYDVHAPGASPDADHVEWYRAMLAAAPQEGK